MNLQLRLAVFFVLALLPGYCLRSWSRSVSGSSSNGYALISRSYSNNGACLHSKTALNVRPRKMDVGLEPARVMHEEEVKAHHVLLSANEERMHARHYRLKTRILEQAERMREKLQRNATTEEVAASMNLTVDNVKTLMQKGELAQQMLIKHNMRLVFHIVRLFETRGVSLPDLLDEGVLGLMKAIEKFDPDRGFRFATYASWWVKQSISRAVAEKSRLIRMPVHVHDLVITTKQTEKEFMQLYRRKPTAKELSNIMCLPEEKVKVLLQSSKWIRSTSEELYRDNGKSSRRLRLHHRVVSATQMGDDEAYREGLHQQMKACMNKLLPKEVEVLEKRFGFGDQKPMTLEVLGQDVGFTRERVRQIESMALSKLRSPELLKGMMDAYDEQLSDEERKPYFRG